MSQKRVKIYELCSNYKATKNKKKSKNKKLKSFDSSFI